MFRYSILFNVLFLYFVSSSSLAQDRCYDMQAFPNLAIEIENISFTSFKTCTDTLGKNEKYHAYTLVAKTDANNCVYARVQLDKVDNSWVTTGSVLNPFFAKSKGGVCPEYDSESYILLNRVTSNSTKEGFFLTLMDFLDFLTKNEETVRTVFSDVGFFDRLFCGMCSEFKKQLLSKLRKERNNTLTIEFVQTDFTSKPDAEMYSLGVKWENQLWVLLLRYEESKLIIKDVSLVQI